MNVCRAEHWRCKFVQGYQAEWTQAQHLDKCLILLLSSRKKNGAAEVASEKTDQHSCPGSRGEREGGEGGDDGGGEGEDGGKEVRDQELVEEDGLQADSIGGGCLRWEGGGGHQGRGQVQVEKEGGNWRRPETGESDGGSEKVTKGFF